MRQLGVAVVAIACGCQQHHPGATLDSEPQPRVCSPMQGSLATIADGTLFGMDASRLFIRTGSTVEAWSKVDGTISSLSVPAGAGFDLVINDVTFAPTAAGDSVVATNLDDGTQWTITLAQPEQIRSLASSPNGELFVRTGDTIQSVDPGATTSRVIVTAPAMTSIRGVAANDDALVWVELDAAGQHLEKLTLASGARVVLADLAATPSMLDTPMTATASDVLFVEYGTYSWALGRRSLSDGQPDGSYAAAPDLATPYAIAIDDSNVYWAPPISHQPRGPIMMNCSSWPGLQIVSVTGGQPTTLDESFGDAPLLVDGQHLYFSAAGITGGCCCGNNVPCTNANGCSLSGAEPPPVVKCYTR